MSRSQVPSNKDNRKAPPTALSYSPTGSSGYDSSLSTSRYSPQEFGSSQNDMLEPPSPSETMVTYHRAPSPARSITDPGPHRQFRDRSKTPLGREASNTQNRRSAVSNPVIQQDLAGFDVPKQAPEDGPEPDILSDFNSVEDCCRFVRDVRSVALRRRLNQDKRWMAEYAGTRLEGKAMIWHELELDDATRSNWDKLQQAILERARGVYANSPPPFRSRLSSNQSVSTTSSARNARSRSGSQNSTFLQGPDAPLVDSPASDASPAGTSYSSMMGSRRTGSASSHSSAPRSSYPLPQSGRLLLRDYTGILHYVGVSVSLSGLFKRTSEEHEALYVKVDRDRGKLYLQNSQSRGRTLGITWDIEKDCTPHLGKGSKDRAYLVYLDHNHKSSGQGWTLAGPSKDAIWRVYADNSVHPVWTDENGVNHELQVVVKAESFRMWHLDTISLVTDAEAFMKDHSDYIRSHLVLDPQV